MSCSSTPNTTHSGDVCRLLVLSDTHLGFDLPRAPRVERRRRGPEFFRAYHAALLQAETTGVDAVIHLGDLFFRSKVRDEVVSAAFVPLLRIADAGVPVYLVPGNHERSAIPRTLFDQHPLIGTFSRPRSFLLHPNRPGAPRVCLAGFPNCRDHARDRATGLIAETGYGKLAADMRLLCLHQIFEGAQVGPRDFTFHRGSDVLRLEDIPANIDLTLSGHVHRHQLLGHRRGVLYPGSTERTSFTEEDETKGYVMLSLGGAEGVQWRFHSLATPPMYTIDLPAHVSADERAVRYLQSSLARLPSDSVVRVRPHPSRPDSASWFSAAVLRAISPPTMLVRLSIKRARES